MFTREQGHPDYSAVSAVSAKSKLTVISDFLPKFFGTFTERQSPLYSTSPPQTASSQALTLTSRSLMRFIPRRQNPKLALHDWRSE